MQKMRVATVERVLRIDPIHNTNLQYVFTTGDNYSITHLDEFSVNEYVVYIYKGALLPDVYNCQKYTRHGFVKAVNILGHYSNGVIVECLSSFYDGEKIRFPVGTEVSYKLGITTFRGNGPKRHPNITKSFGRSYYEYTVNRNLFVDSEKLYFRNVKREERNSVKNTIELDTTSTTFLMIWLLLPVFYIGRDIYNRG